ncbi:hypothetical protein PGIGA_G00082490 [Pangasianodon gigas]|uniref:Uncharacterized protein n=1 Tax=Pangasianodon gigas TaxID=30993 RepID=A0ACC5XA90_PANGG|nr:hypothetical protein [Pangasianodon gigas]
MENVAEFTGKRHSAKKSWVDVFEKMGLNRIVTPSQIAKKWDNLKRKYKVGAPLSSYRNRDSGEVTAATWPWFSAMHEAIGGRPSIETPVLIDACDAEVTGYAAVASDMGSSPPAAVSQASVEEEEESSSPSSTNSLRQEDEPTTLSCLPPPKRRRSNRVFSGE